MHRKSLHSFDAAIAAPRGFPRGEESAEGTFLNQNTLCFDFCNRRKSVLIMKAV